MSEILDHIVLDTTYHQPGLEQVVEIVFEGRPTGYILHELRMPGKEDVSVVRVKKGTSANGKRVKGATLAEQYANGPLKWREAALKDQRRFQNEQKAEHRPKISHVVETSGKPECVTSLTVIG